jgi:hypothetical protein
VCLRIDAILWSLLGESGLEPEHSPEKNNLQGSHICMKANRAHMELRRPEVCSAGFYPESGACIENDRRH